MQKMNRKNVYDMENVMIYIYIWKIGNGYNDRQCNN
jgi:hypothetical protein